MREAESCNVKKATYIIPEPAPGRPHWERDVVFVFGSNLAGIHGAGAALHAKQHWGARTGDGQGRTGSAYALPTKDRQLQRLSLPEIAGRVKTFLEYARRNPAAVFLVTRVGCGLAGYREEQVAPFFKGAPPHVILPPGWRHKADVTPGLHTAG